MGNHASHVGIDDREPASCPAAVNDGLTLLVHARPSIATAMGASFTGRRGSSLGREGTHDERVSTIHHVLEGKSGDRVSQIVGPCLKRSHRAMVVVSKTIATSRHIFGQGDGLLSITMKTREPMMQRFCCKAFRFTMKRRPMMQSRRKKVLAAFKMTAVSIDLDRAISQSWLMRSASL
jgi:hypothetical protein